MRLTPYGYREIGIAFIATTTTAVALLFLSSVTAAWVAAFAVIPLLLLLQTLYFFRDPKRVVPDGDGLLVSAADGVITHVEEISAEDAPELLGGAALRETRRALVERQHVGVAVLVEGSDFCGIERVEPGPGRQPDHARADTVGDRDAG